MSLHPSEIILTRLGLKIERDLGCLSIQLLGLVFGDRGLLFRRPIAGLLARSGSLSSGRSRFNICFLGRGLVRCRCTIELGCCEIISGAMADKVMVG